MDHDATDRLSDCGILITTDFSEDAYQALARRAEAVGRSVGDYLRWLGVQDAREHGVEVADTAGDDANDAGKSGDTWWTPTASLS